MMLWRRAWFEWLALFSFFSASIAAGAAQSPAEQVAPKTPGSVVFRVVRLARRFQCSTTASNHLHIRPIFSFS
jgi:hypothetical protein